MKYTDPKYQNDVLKMVGDYCGKPVSNYTDDPIRTELTWTFYHSFFFAFTVCSTVGMQIDHENHQLLTVTHSISFDFIILLLN